MTDPRVRVLTTVTDSNDVALIGDQLAVLSAMKAPGGGLATFVTPGVAHLALDAAVRSAKLANECRSTLTTSQPTLTVLPGPVTHIDDGQQSGALYDTFLHAMSSAIFSYLAVENFSNEVIGRHPEALVEATVEANGVTRSKKSDRKRRQKILRRAGEAERESLGVKISQVLPQITGVQLEKGREPYQQFRQLEKIRHNVVHMKSGTSMPRVLNLTNVPEQPVWSNFIYQDSLWMPTAALNMIRHFWIETLPLDWISSIEAQIKGDDPPNQI